MTAFWMVWNEGSRCPGVKHFTEQSARQEAERLARNNPGRRFHVLVVVASCRNVDVEWTENYEDVPLCLPVDTER